MNDVPGGGETMQDRICPRLLLSAARARSGTLSRVLPVCSYPLLTLVAKAHIAIIQSILRVFPPPRDCYLYGPACVAESERGKGIAAVLFKELQTHMSGRPAMTFIRADNSISLQAHRKIGMKELGSFTADGVAHIALGYEGLKSG